jgi:2-phospho-L-lactate guanylyltransferase
VPVSEWALPTAALGPSVVLIPVKAFHQAKRRLGNSLPEQDRVQLVRSMATHVLTACTPLPVAVVCDDEEVAQWASDLGAAVMWEPGQGLNGAVRAGVRRLVEAGTEWVTVPDRRDDGTNVLRLPARAFDFCFAYGPGSFRAHRAEAMRIGLAVRVVRNPHLAYDVDWPADVDELMRTTASPPS